MKALVWDGRGARRQVGRRRRSPPTCVDAGRRVPRRADRRPSPASTRTSSRSSSARRRSPSTSCASPSARPPSPARSCPSSTAPPSRTRACSRCSTPSSTTCRRRSTCRRSQGMNLKGDETLERKADDNEPFAALAFKIMTDPHVGKLTYFRVYSRHARQGRPGPQHPHRQQGAHRPPARDARQRPARTSTPSSPATSSPASASRTPRPATRSAIRGTRSCSRSSSSRAGDPRRRRAQDQGRPGQDGQGALLAVRGGPDLPGPHRRGDRPDHHLRHGRAAPRGARRPHAARVQGRRHRRQAAGRLPRDHHARRSRSVTYTHKKQTGGSGQYAEVTDHHRDHRPRWRLRVRRQDQRRPHPQGVHPLGRRTASRRP